MCELFTVSRSGYYNWLKKQEADNNTKQLLENDLLKLIEEIIAKFSGYGYRRVKHELKRRGQIVNHKKVLRLMRDNNLIKKQRRFKVCTTCSNHGMKVYPNVAKSLKLTDINQLWVSDITYIKINNRTLYLAVILDGYSRYCVGWSLGKNMTTHLVEDALAMALSRRQTKDKLVHHSDRGSQYASTDYTRMLHKNNITISMSRKASPYDNAKAESFMKTIKYEEIYINDYKNASELYNSVETYIESVYNNERLHSSLGYQTPKEFEDNLSNIYYRN
jgi:transposase InsO family protein